MKPEQEIKIADYDYDLPQELIAQFPLDRRDESRLLVYRDNLAGETIFRNISEHLPSDALMVFNDTRVIRARLIFSRETGSTIEIFCLEPAGQATEIQQVFSSKGRCTWNCLVGNVRRWKGGDLKRIIDRGGKRYELRARLLERLEDGCFLVEFSWDPPEETFSVMLEMAGLVPLPPYIERAAAGNDAERYQTIFAENEGSVAAPTAGLHFTPEVLEKIAAKNIVTEKVTLHVGLGTFRPVSAPVIYGHSMHPERMMVSLKTIENLLRRKGALIAVGTTTVRTLESLYWAGVKIRNGEDPADGIGQWDPYKTDEKLPVTDSLTLLTTYLRKNSLENISLDTSIIIVPGYRFRLTDILITNFHQPQSTLLLLVSAFAGEDWREAYQFAINRRFRFLSYGDACLFFRHQ